MAVKRALMSAAPCAAARSRPDGQTDLRGKRSGLVYRERASSAAAARGVIEERDANDRA